MAANIGKLKPSSAVNVYITTKLQFSQERYLEFTGISFNPNNYICVAAASGVSVGGTSTTAGIAYINGTAYQSEISINGTLLSANSKTPSKSHSGTTLRITPGYSSSRFYLTPGTWILVYWS